MHNRYRESQMSLKVSKNFQPGISDVESVPYIKGLREWANQRVSEDLEARRNPIPLPPIKTYKIQGSGNNIYTLTVRGINKSCSSPGYQFRGKCNHATLWTPAFGRV